MYVGTTARNKPSTKPPAPSTKMKSSNQASIGTTLQPKSSPKPLSNLSPGTLAAVQNTGLQTKKSGSANPAITISQRHSVKSINGAHVSLKKSASMKMIYFSLNDRDSTRNFLVR